MRECSYDQVSGSDPGLETIPVLWSNFSKTDFGKINSVTIDNGVTSIGTCAFMIAFNLKKVTIPSSVTRINYYAFANCQNLKELIIPSSVTTIEDDAFWDCGKLTIKGKAGSVAQKYAKSHNIKFIAI